MPFCLRDFDENSTYPFCALYAYYWVSVGTTESVPKIVICNVSVCVVVKSIIQVLLELFKTSVSIKRQVRYDNQIPMAAQG